MTIRVLLAEDHLVVAQGIAAELAAQDEFEVVGIATRAGQAVEMARRLKPDITLMDICLPRGKEGLTALKEILKHDPKAKVLILTGFPKDQWIAEAMDAGACGYLLKETSSDKLVETIRAVVHGGRGTVPEFHRGALTVREVEVLRLAAKGLGNKEIGAALHITVRTVKEHIGNIMAKLEAGSRIEAINRGEEMGYIVPGED